MIQMWEQQFFLIKLLGYDYKIEYKLGHSNKVPDTLSRKTTEEQIDLDITK